MQAWHFHCVARACGIAFVLMIHSIAADPQLELSPDILSLFQRFDALGTPSIEDAKYVTVDFEEKDGLGRKNDRTISGWLLAEDEKSLTLFENELRPIMYQKDKPTTLPSSWGPKSVEIVAVHDADFESKLRELLTPDNYAIESRSGDGSVELIVPPVNPHHRPATRSLAAYAAWKKGMTSYSGPIIQGDFLNQFKFDQNFSEGVWEDLAWRHFLRGVNILMYGDRKEVIQHIKLSIEISPDADFREDRKKLVSQLESIVENEPEKKSALSVVDESPDVYIAQLVDLHCEQDGQPGFINPFQSPAFLPGYQDIPTIKLRELGMPAVPALIAALENDTPTRTVFHFRDYAHNRYIWKVSDFAWNILRQISSMDFGYKRSTGFTFGLMEPEQKKVVIDAINRWYKTKDLSEEEQMLARFQSQDFEEWMTAAAYFMKKNDRRAIPPLLENLKKAGPQREGNLCGIIARFGDLSTKDAIREITEPEHEPFDRMLAAQALDELGENAAVPMAMELIKSNKDEYPKWTIEVNVLMKSKTPESMEFLKSELLTDTPYRANKILSLISELTPGSRGFESAGSVELAPVVVAAMDRADLVGEKAPSDLANFRVKDQAAIVFALMKGHAKADERGKVDGRYPEIDPAFFDENEPDISKRDAQIDALKKWYADNKAKLVWNAASHRLEIE